ncbi:MAG: DUF3833 family protein [Luteimonas sp.]
MKTIKYLAKPILLAALLASPVTQSGTPANPFVPEQVFAGRSEGKGTLTLLGKARAFTVESLGTTVASGQLKLEQSVRFEGKPARSRTWLITQTTPGHYTATLTDAAGPVVGRSEGNRLSLRYPLTRWGLVMHQTLDLSSDGQTLDNHGSIRLMGIPIGELDETIRLNP